MSLAGFLPFVVLIALFWFLLIRPQMKRSRDLRDLQSTLSKGDRVMLASGIYAEVRGFADDGVLVQVARGVTMKVTRGAISEVFKKEELEQVLPDDLHEFMNSSDEFTDPLLLGADVVEGTVADSSVAETEPAETEPAIESVEPARPIMPSGLGAALDAAAEQERDYDPSRNPADKKENQ